MLLPVRFDKIDGENVVLQGNLLFFPCQMDILLCLTFSTISTLVRQLPAEFVFCFFNEIFYKAIYN